MLPQLNRIRKSVTNINIFRGINRSCNIGFSRVSSNNTSVYTEFKDMKNLTSDKYPQMSPRKRRSRLITLNNADIISNILSVNDGLIYLDNKGYLFYCGKYKEINGIDTNDFNHQLINYGNNVLVFPEKIIFNLTTGIITSMEQVNEGKQCSSSIYTATEEAPEGNFGFDFICSIDKVAMNTSVTPRNKRFTVTTSIDFSDSSLQRTDGVKRWETFFNEIEVGDCVETAKTIPSILYMCTSEESQENYYNNKLRTFTVIENYYVRISAPGIGTGFKANDFVKIYGMAHSVLKDENPDNNPSLIDEFKDTTYIDVLNNNIFKLYGASNDYIIIKVNINSSVPYTGKISVSRTIPNMDEGLMIECDNRLWGCSSASNEIYACRQGDCTNWYAYSDAISTDSFAMTVGCEGEFTGVARQNSSIIFFKENWALKIYGTKPSNFTLASYNVAGVEKGSRKSLVWLNGILFYKAKNGIVEYSPGAQPQIISQEAFGDVAYKNAVGGTHRSKYYVSLEKYDGTHELFVFDSQKAVWHREDNTNMLNATTYNDYLYYVDGNTGYIMCPEEENNLLESTGIKAEYKDTGRAGEMWTDISGNEHIYGDIDDDGIISNDDLVLLQEHIGLITVLNDNALISADVNGDGIIDINDITCLQKYINVQNFEKEDFFDWYAETGDLYDSDFETKYISKIRIGIKPEAGTQVRLFAQFEDNGTWQELSNIQYKEKVPRIIPVMVRRAEFLRLRLEGAGQCEIYGVDIEYAKGSDHRNGYIKNRSASCD